MSRPCIARAADRAEFHFREGCYITEQWNVADDPALSLARARVPPGARTRRHCLEGVTERYLILEGAGRVEVDGLAASTVGPGDVVLIPPGVAQRITSTGDTDLVFVAACTPRFRSECYRDLESDPEG